MKCLICKSEETEVIFDDYIRDGAPETLTKEKYQMYQCRECGTIFHKINTGENMEYYQSTEYREKLENNADILNYYMLHDREVLEKLQYTGTDCFRNAIAADIGCGGGSFLDFISGAAKKIIAIEPSAYYREKLKEKNYATYAYASDAMEDYSSSVDIVTSFDVIEHADNPNEFMTDVYKLLKPGGKAVIGTPSDCPVMRLLMGKEYEQKLLYSFQHPWILSEKGFELCCKKAGFQDVRIEQKQRYGISNMIKWLIEKKPSGQFKYDFVSDTLDKVYKSELEKGNIADYLVAYVKKN